MPNLLLENNPEESRDFEPIPGGLYDARIDTSESEVGESVNGNAYVTIAFVIENSQAHTGRKLNQRFYLNKKAQWKISSMLSRLGLLPETPGEFSLDTDTLHNIKCRIRVSQRTYEGNTFNDVQAVFGRGSGKSGNKKASSF